MKLLLSVLLALIATAASADEIARQFASVASGRILTDKDPAVAKADNVLTSLSKRCQESRQKLADMLAKGQDMLKSDGINQPLLPMAEGISYAAGTRCGSGKAIEVIMFYIATRQKGLTHRESVEGVHDMLASMR